MTFLKEDLNKIIQAIKKLADSGQENNSPEQEIVESGERHYLSEDLTLIAQAIRDLNENNEITVEKSEYLSENLNEIAQAIENINIIKPEGTIEITQNGNYNISNYANAEVNIDGITINENYDITDKTLNIGEVTLNGEIIANIPEKIETISGKAFYNNILINRVIIPDSVTTIADGAPWLEQKGAFRECTALKKVNFPIGLTRIGDFSFDGCVQLEDFEIPNTVNYIGDWAFGSCNTITTINIPESIDTINAGAFAGCNNLATVIIPSSITTIKEQAFDACANLDIVDLTSFNSSNIPALLNKNTFGNHSEYIKFKFKDWETLNAFGAETNWSTLTEYFIVAE